MLKLNQHTVFKIAILFVLQSLSGYSSKSIQFSYLTTKDNLSNNFVTSIHEDSKGYLWFGTSDGLNRWNGYEMKTYRFILNEVNSIPDNFINCLTEDNQNNIWIGTTLGGLARYNLSEEKFYRYSANPNDKNTLRSNYIRKIVTDCNETVWVCTDRGISKYSPTTDNFEEINFPGANNVYDANSCYELSNNDLLFQTDVGLFLYHPASNTFNRFKLPGINTPEKYNLAESPFCFSSDGYLWVGSETGLLRYNLRSNNYKLYLHNTKDSRSISSNDVSVIFEDSKKNLWIGTKNSGLNLYNKKTDDFDTYSLGTADGNNLSDYIISTINEDSYNNIWIGTQEGGLNYFNDQRNRYAHYKKQSTEEHSLKSNRIGAIFEDGSGRIWVGSGDGWLHEHNVADNSFTSHKFQGESIAPMILGLAVKNSNELYVTGWGVGLYTFNYGTRKFTAVEGNPKNRVRFGKTIKGIGKDSKGNVWLATHLEQKMVVYNETKNEYYDEFNPGDIDIRLLKVPYAVSMMEDSKHRIWILTYVGLFMFDGEFHEFKSTSDPNTLSSNYLYAICETSDSTIWIGNTNGLDKLIKKKGTYQFERYNLKTNLPNSIKSIIEGKKGILWLSSNQGIHKFNTTTYEVRNFNINKELPNQEFFERSCLKSSTGEIYFGGTRGLIKFFPDSLERMRNTQRIYISDFQVFNKSQKPKSKNSPLEVSISETKQITLSHNQSVISFEYEILELGYSGLFEYAYILEGLDDGWNFVGSKRFATYTNLSPGKYVFRVRPASGTNIIGNSEANIIVTITPPFWRTLWAYLFYLLLSLFLLYLFRRQILTREKVRNELNLQKLELKNISETNLMKIRFFSNISHEFRTPLTLINGPVEELIDKDASLQPKERQYHYNLIRKNTQKLMDMVDQLMDYRKLETGSLVLEPLKGDMIETCRNSWRIFKLQAEEKNIKYEFHSTAKSTISTFDAHKLEIILTNLLSNAFKNTAAGGSILFSVSHEEVNLKGTVQQVIQFTVKDSGSGIPEKDLPRIFDRFYTVSKTGMPRAEGTGIGLTLVKELTELHHGTIEVKSTEAVGSEFTVRIPLDNEFYETQNEVHSHDREPALDEKPGLISEVIETKINGQQSHERLKILIVEDEKELRSFLKYEFEKDFSIIEAVDGEDGLRKAIFMLPDIVISDIMMPNIDGIELCNTLKTDERTSHIPVILLTAWHEHDKEIEGFESGADAYVTKPFNVKVLRAQVENLLKIRKDLFEKFQKGTSLFFNEKGVDTKDKQFIQKVINIVLQNISNEKLNAEFLATKMLVSRSVIYLKVEALTGQSVNEFIRNIRLKKAIQLLQQKELTINEIGCEVGFSSHSYFTRSFTKQFGCSPKEYVSKMHEE
jgi:signal transduction histidine kinase/ligand-binding sensor domain-containing protein/DNA-binding response OmpR family regulator